MIDQSPLIYQIGCKSNKKNIIVHEKGKKYHLRLFFNGSGIKNVVIVSVFQFFILNLQTLKQFIYV